jgi:tRNA (guanine37-N1)-methyltransferase
MAMRFDVLTLFPGMFPGYLGQSLLGKSIEKGLVSVRLHDLREWSSDPHNRVDDRPFGGGPGMILMVDPVVRAAEAIQAMDPRPATVVMMTPGGRKMDQRLVEDFSSGGSRYLILCGRYEGFDQRVSDLLQPVEISIGDYILNGGEVAAMVMIDAMIRLVPGVLGDDQSNIEDSFSSGNRLLEFPQYTRPREYRGLGVPEILLGGNHPEIRRWRDEQSRKRTEQRRQDLLDPGEP